MIRRIGTELRRSNARVLAILLLVGSLGTLAVSQDWGRQWWQFSYYLAANLFLQVPLALAAGAMLGRRERRTGAAELLASTGRPRWQKITPTAAALAITVVVVQLSTLAAGAARIGAAGGFLSLAGAAPALADVTILIGAAWTGLAAGRAWASPLLPPMLAGAALVAQVLASTSNDPLSGETSRWESLSLLPQPPNAYWESATAEAVLGRLGLGLGLALGGWLLVVGARWPSRLAGVGAVLAGLALITQLTPTGGPYARYRIDTAAQQLVCSDGTPQVCVTAVRAYELNEVTAAARRALTMLARLPGAPARAVEWRADRVGNGDPAQFWGPDPRTDPGTVMFALGGWGAPSAADVTASILNGAGTTMNGCEPGDEVALGAAGAWLMGADGLPLRDGGSTYSDEVSARIGATVRALRQLPGPEQVRRVTALRDAAADCRNDDLLAILTDGTAS
ncbi:hypothetical protein Aph02nite_89730 [Actinoplanes philippinensis]|uniref:Uncharacterized protein n=1 Tax=Actinoplanes philippinensis TaxID=35752 RepID=A0A1I2M5B5_9ACTN|nr:hypothetical protein [Actinoplanes philippinensis]GIE83023.1 hypothetical protein Aph02nite_89730 [Actinoplanes philippinensis]SFF86050.1 hypothetical protein SAMN05421541_12637 [Actinoplanes philippinensis]